MALEERGVFFDVWSADDLTGTALGELTQSFDRQFTKLRNAIGSGQFSINRHDTQYADGWAAQDNYVRVRQVVGGPFDFDDARYVGGFFIETGEDEIASTDEEGGDVITRGGRTTEAYLERAVGYPDGTSSLATDKITHTARIDGNWHFTNVTAGEVLNVYLEDARSRGALAALDNDFGHNKDSLDVDWDDVGTDWSIPVGTNYLDILGTCVSGSLLYRVGPDFVFHAYQDDPGNDLSSSIELQYARDITQSASRQINARSTKSRVIVEGTKANNRLKFREVIDSTIEADDRIGRREGFVEYKATPTNAKLDKAGHRFMTKAKRRHDGPDSALVLEYTGRVAFEDYDTWDTVKYHVPGEYSHRSVVVYGITITQRAANDRDVLVQFEQSPFDPSAGDNAEITDDGTKPGTKTCGDCPDQPPFVPGTPTPSVTALAVVYRAGADSAVVSDPSPNVKFIGTGDHPPSGKPLVPLVGDLAYYLEEGDHNNYGIAATQDGVVDVDVTAKPSAAFGAPVTLTLSLLKNGSVIGFMSASASGGFFNPDLYVHVAGVSMSAGDHFTAHVSCSGSCGGIIGIGPLSTGGPYHIDGMRVSGATIDPSDITPPTPGQLTTEQLTGDGSTTVFQTNYPYEPGSLVGHVTVDGILTPVDETDPTTGTFTFDSAPANDAVIIVTYQVADATATGANNPQPTPSTPAGGGSALVVAEDGSTVVSPASGGLDFRHGLDVSAPGGGVARVDVDEAELDVLALASSSTDATKVFAPDGAGGVIARDETALTGVLFNIHGEEHVVQAHGAMGATETMDLANGNVHSGTLDANCTITLTGFVPGVRSIMQVRLTENGTGGFTPSFTCAGSLGFIGGTPTQVTTAGSVTEYIFWSDDGGTTVTGGMLGGGGQTPDVPALTFGTAAAQGSSSHYVATDATLPIFDGTVPVTQAFSDAAATGSAAYAARRDHRHGMPASSGGIVSGQILVSDTPAGSPLVFSDLLQNETQTDLIYADT